MEQFYRKAGLFIILLVLYASSCSGLVNGDYPVKDNEDLQKIDNLLKKSGKYLQLDLFQRSLVFVDSALQLSYGIEHIESITQSLMFKSDIFIRQKQYNEAINIYFELIYYLNSTGNEIHNTFIYKQIASLYSKLSKFDSSIIYYRKAISYAKKIGNKQLLANLHLDLGKAFVMNNEFTNGETTFNLAYNYADTLQANNLMIEAKIELASLFDKLNDFGAAELFISDASRMLEAYSNDTLKSKLLYFQANILYHSGKTDKAIELSTASYDLSMKLNLPVIVKSNLLLLRDIAFVKKDYKKALTYADLYAEYLIHQSEEKRAETLKDSRIVLELERQEQELKKLRSDKALQKELLTGKTHLIYALIALGLMAAIVAVLLFYRAKSRKKAMENEIKQKEKIERQNKKLNKINKQLTEAKASAEFSRDLAIKADKAKTAFLDIMSHEIRTPLAGIIGMINVLKDIDLDSDKREKLQVIEQSSNDLLDIFNDILEFIKLESGSLDIEKSEFSIRDMVKDVEIVYMNRAKKSGLDLNIRIDREIPDHIISDRMRLNQVLKSLISNAIKFTNKGKVELALRYLGTTDSMCTFRVEVIDTGIGMTLDEIKNIFMAFSPAHTSFSREYHGIGLSLAIVKKLVHLMESAIQVESSKGHGSRFWFDLTVPFNENGKKKSLSTPVSYSVAKLRILLAEDNELMQKVGAANLSKYGHVDIAHRLSTIKKSDHIIVMDLQMPNVNGWESTEMIRGYEKANGQEKRIPIIALTANVSQKDRNKSFESGMDYFAEKPIRPEVLDKIFDELSV